VGNLEGHTVFLHILWESLNGARDNSEAFRIVLFAIFKDNLRSETNAQYGLSFVYPFRYPLIEVCLPQIGHRFTRGTNAREDYTAGLLQYFGIITDQARFPQITKSSCYTGQIPGLIINDSYHYALPKDLFPHIIFKNSFCNVNAAVNQIFSKYAIHMP
jgi:hypothetical protein